MIAKINLGWAAMMTIPTTPATAKPGGIQRAGRRIESHANQIAPITRPIRVSAEIKKSLVDSEPVQLANHGVTEAIAATANIDAATIPAIARRTSGDEGFSGDAGEDEDSSPSCRDRSMVAKVVRKNRISSRE